ncbi:hypothetical protein [Arcobacter porcinus]|uniref:Uncharacterized protein n=1 Tax=Arcobacter porcinus TaxID=1935204 RepID=A0A5C2HGI8_9BACT|nr:hypothetical protein [Arcobacter porcinus]OCL89435.1 hypothetical protein AAX27_01966 [Aliarcobacter thereius]QEP40431.1 hypothetical protein APORC_0820 [Arcobacter porcinus]
MNQKYKNHFPFIVYEKMFIDKTGSELDNEELEYLLNFCNQCNYLNSSKELYSYSMLLLKRFYPVFLVRIIIELKTKKILKITDAPESLKKLYKEIADIVIVSSMPNSRRD